MAETFSNIEIWSTRDMKLRDLQSGKNQKRFHQNSLIKLPLAADISYNSTAWDYYILKQDLEVRRGQHHIPIYSKFSKMKNSAKRKHLRLSFISKEEVFS